MCLPEIVFYDHYFALVYYVNSIIRYYIRICRCLKRIYICLLCLLFFYEDYFTLLLYIISIIQYIISIFCMSELVLYYYYIALLCYIISIFSILYDDFIRDYIPRGETLGSVYESGHFRGL